MEKIMASLPKAPRVNPRPLNRFRQPEGDISSDTPALYALRLSKYIKDASTVRARTMEQFGRAPSIDDIRDMIAEQARVKALEHNTYLLPKHDGRFKSTLPKLVAAPPPPVAEEPPFDAPPWVGGFLDVKDRITKVAQSFGLTYDDIVGRNRRPYICNVRYLVIVLLIERGNSRSKIGQWLGGRDHSTICNGEENYDGVAKRNPPIARAYAHFRKEWGIDCD